MEMAWTEQLSVGNELIDSEHRNLISLANGVIRAIQARNSSGLAQAFEQLELWLCLHFANEEKMAQAINFDFSNHQLAQHYGLNELRFLRGLLVAKNCLWFDGAVEHFTHFLKNWMIDDHIVRLDMRMKPVLQTRPYSFRIDEANFCG
ncbi:MAG: hemerythrin family protein [Gallionella sp.]|nr:hemerythrin family protein [Gallionella sp.]